MTSVAGDGMRVKSVGAATATALIVAHCAGMIDLVALPVWVGALVARYGFEPQMAGGLATLFLLGAVAASVLLAPRFTRLNQKWVATLGFGVSALAFLGASTQTGYGPLAGLHLVAGFATGTALSMVHGSIGHSANPHRLFAMAGIALGLFGIVFMGAVPQILIALGGASLFQVFAGVMAVGALACGLLMSNPKDLHELPVAPWRRSVWLVIFGVSLMTFNQAMVFSFVEVIGGANGIPREVVLGVLIAIGVVNLLFPAPLAALLEKRLDAHRVTQAGPVLQAVLALVITSVAWVPAWAPAAAIFVAVQIFTHTFAFGLLARLDPTGRAVAATPAMLMIGAALGPVAGGALGQNLGYGALGIAAVVVALISVAFFTKASRA